MPRLTNISKYSYPILLGSILGRSESSEATGSLAYNINDDNSFFHSDLKSYIGLGEDNTSPQKEITYFSNQLIEFENSFKEQYEKLNRYFEDMGYNYNSAKSVFLISISPLLELNPDALTMELMPEGSIFYTMQIRDFTFFLQHYLFYSGIEEEDEAILSIYKDHEKQPSFAGSLNAAISELNSILYPYNTMKLQLQLNELPG
jgi:hypothetical protein